MRRPLAAHAQQGGDNVIATRIQNNDGTQMRKSHFHAIDWVGHMHRVGLILLVRVTLPIFTVTRLKFLQFPAHSFQSIFFFAVVLSLSIFGGCAVSIFISFQLGLAPFQNAFPGPWENLFVFYKK